MSWMCLKDRVNTEEYILTEDEGITYLTFYSCSTAQTESSTILGSQKIRLANFVNLSDVDSVVFFRDVWAVFREKKVLVLFVVHAHC